MDGYPFGPKVGPMTAAALLPWYMMANIPVMLWGPPGAAKSSISAQVADAMNRRLIDLRLAQMDPIDIAGAMVPDMKRGITRRLRPWWVPDGSEPTFVLLDELSSAIGATQVAAYPIVLDRRVGETPLPDNCYVAAAGNRAEDKAVTYQMSSALANRMAHLTVEPSIEDTLSWAAGMDVPVNLPEGKKKPVIPSAVRLHPDVMSFLRVRPSLLSVPIQTGVMAYPSSRTWSMLSRVLYLEPPDDKEHLLSGSIIGGASGEFELHRKLVCGLPDPVEILKDPKRAKVPSRADELTAVATSLGARVTAKTLDPFVEYLNRLDVEYSVIAMKDAKYRLEEEMRENKSCLAWALRHKDIVLWR